MIRKGIIIDTMRYEIVRECTYEDTRVEGIYVKVDGKDLIPLAYVYPIENRNLVLAELETLKEAKKAYDDKVSYVYYKVFPKLREVE